MKYYKEFLKGLSVVDRKMEEVKRKMVRKTVDSKKGILIGFALYMFVAIGAKVLDREIVIANPQAAINCPTALNVAEEVQQLEKKEQVLTEALNLQYSSEVLETLMNDFLSSYEKVETHKEANANLTYLDRLQCRQMNGKK